MSRAYRRPPNPPLIVASMAAFVAGIYMVSTATTETMGAFVTGAALLLGGMVVFAFEISKL